MNNYAIATDGLATGLQDSASALKTAGNDFYEAAALVTAGNTVTQDPDSVGKGMRTISLRLTGTDYAKQQLEDLGEEVDDFEITTKEKMRDTIKDLTKVQGQAGVDILDMNGNFRSTYEILLDISRVWEKMAEEDKITGQNRQNAILEKMAGKNRANILASILQSPDVLENAYQSAITSQNSAQDELNKYLDSIEGRMTQFKNHVQELLYDTIDTELVKNIISAGSGGIKLLDTLIDKVGVLGTLLPGIAAGMSAIKNQGRTKMLVLSKYALCY